MCLGSPDGGFLDARARPESLLYFISPARFQSDSANFPEINDSIRSMILRPTCDRLRTGLCDRENPLGKYLEGFCDISKTVQKPETFLLKNVTYAILFLEIGSGVFESFVSIVS